MRPELIALHKHWCTADAVKQFVWTELPDSAVDKELPEGIHKLAVFTSAMSRLSVWYSLLYVVIEGFLELGLSHPEVDAALENEEYVKLLRLFRNATFHYQKDPLTDKAKRFLCAEESEKWIHSLNKAFDRFFLETLPIREQMDAIKNRNP